VVCPHISYPFGTPGDEVVNVSDVPVDGDRLRRDIERNAQFGAVPTDKGQARTVLPGTESNRGARKHLVERMIQADLAVSVDSVGNIVGEYAPENCDPAAEPVAVGSHLDSVPFGGIFDGPLGVYAGLESVRAIQESEVQLTRPVQVVCFTGEEGTRFADGVLGSSVAAGLLDPKEALALSDGDQTLRDALNDIGFHGKGQVNAGDWHAWLELHVEQSDRLEQLGLPAGVVTNISGTTRLHIDIEGAANHTGTTSMGERTDALAAASEFILELEQVAQDSPETAVATVGELHVEPGAVNVVPGRVECRAEVRDVDQATLDQIVEDVQSVLAELEITRGVTTSMTCSYQVRTVDMATQCQEALHDAGAAIGIETAAVHSGAGHDSMQVARVTDAGLLFAPSKGGHSHNNLEWTEWPACTATTEILTSALTTLASDSQ